MVEEVRLDNVNDNGFDEKSATTDRHWEGREEKSPGFAVDLTAYKLH